MAIEVVQLVRGVLTIKITGVLSEQDIDQLQYATCEAVAQWNRIRVLIVLDDFDGAANSSLNGGAGSLKSDRQAIERLAIVGDGGCATVAHSYLGEGLPVAATEYFSLAERDRAVIWIVDGL